MTVIIDASSKGLIVVDHITAHLDNDTLTSIPALMLNPDMQILRASVDGRELIEENSSLGQQLLTPMADGHIQLPVGSRELVIEYRNDLMTDDWPWITLLPQEAWYPTSIDTPLSFNLDVRVPSNWVTLSQGASDSEVDGNSSDDNIDQQYDNVATYRQFDPQQGIYLIAGPYVDYHREARGYRARVMLRDADARLADSYLSAALVGLERYSAALGEYPYHSFTLVENQQQTGWGMPGFTLLGSEVIRLPFIIHTSFPHELLHNWWGNGIFVDYSSGNWSEGLTTYLSDYLDREENDHARQYRLDTLISWDNFAKRQGDFPLSEFIARHDRATQAVGYGRGLYLFHMLRGQLGDAKFLEALKKFYHQYLFKYASFDDIRDVFESVCECSLEEFFRQWLYRSGAPRLTLEKATLNEAGNSLEITLGQENPPWRLRVPLRLMDTNGNSHWRFMPLQASMQSETFVVDTPIARVDVDPDFDVFRMLDASEKPVTISELFAADHVVVDPADESFAPLARSMVSGRNGWSVAKDGSDAGADGLILLGRNHPLAEEIFDQRIVNESLALDGAPVRISAESVVVLAGAKNLNGHNTIVLWIIAQADERLADLLRRLAHYGRQSYLVFDRIDQRASFSGQWRTGGGGLTRVFVDDPPAVEVNGSKPLF
ncbi:MAG: hypothetical protein DHS20C01_12760 [marine bacterium B5-7]|nr:MAG: hypothetical protein DHS20C01_12760 [marine bacterium B5-7]